MIQVIYILSSAHSGSTLADLLLGSHSQIESVGEFDRFPKYFQNGSGRATPCTCGQPVSDCLYWKNVLAGVDGCSIGSDLNNPNSFGAANLPVINSILRVSGKTIFCDSSKSLGRLRNYLRDKNYRVHVLHLVRDGRAVAFSSKRKRARLIRELGGEDKYSDRLRRTGKHDYDFSYAFDRWISFNAKVLWFAFSNKEISYYRLKYEELVDNPEYHVTLFLKTVSLGFEQQQLSFGKHEHHNLGGNRMRTKRNQNIQPDTEFLETLSSSEWWQTTIKGLPLLLRFGYPIGRSRSTKG